MDKLSDPRVFDRQLLLKRLAGDVELVDSILELFMEGCPQMIAEVRTAVSSQDAQQIEISAHSIKGALLNISADSAARTAWELEELGHKRELSGTQDLLIKLEGDLDLLIGELATD